MPTLTIPEDGYEGIHGIASLDEGTFKSMLDGLAKLPPSVYHIGRLVQAISDSTGLARDVSSSIGQAISGLGLLYSRGPLATKEFVEEVLTAVRARTDEESTESDESLAFSDEDLTRIGAYLVQLLELDNVVVSAMALDTLLEVERPVAEARVFADLRPVFARKGDTTISAFAVTTTMKVAWFDPTGGHETYFTLDEADLDSLLSALSEAKKQATALREFVKASDAQYVEMGER